MSALRWADRSFKAGLVVIAVLTVIGIVALGASVVMMALSYLGSWGE